MSEVRKENKNNYEKYSFTHKGVNRVLMKTFDLLPEKISSKLLNVSNEAVHVKKHATTHSAIEVMYTYKKKSIRLGKHFFKNLLTNMWMNFTNPKALRNRLKLVQTIIKKKLEEFRSNNKINILSLGAGSARAIINVISDPSLKDYSINVKLIDKNIHAIIYSKKLAIENEVLEKMEWIQDDVRNFREHCHDWEPNIVEMVGLLDYFDDKKAIELISNIYRLLPSGGYLITCNVNDNYERNFITKIVKWSMIYRNSEQLIDLLNNSGFSNEKIEVIYEPLNIHGVVIGKK